MRDARGQEIAAACGQLAAEGYRGVNRQPHRERIVRGTHRRRPHELPWAGLPAGTAGGSALLVAGGELVGWTNEGHGAAGVGDGRGDHAAVDGGRAAGGYPVQVDEGAR